MKKKILSLMMICLIYIAAVTAGAASLFLLKSVVDKAILNMFIADVIATVIVYIFSLILDNASVYDPYWSVMPVFIVLGYYLCYETSFSAHHLTVLIPLLIWAVRLTYNWITNFEDLQWQDWRYIKYKKNYPKLYQFICFTGIMLMPTCLVFAGTIPLWFFLQSAKISATHVISGIVILAACSLQATADYQMKKFRLRSNVKGVCIDSGVWRYSRHPNYFGEMSVWWGVAVSALGGAAEIISSLNVASYAYYILAFTGAALITLLFVFISVPMMEKYVISKRPVYAEYKRKVRSPLIPFFRNKKVSNGYSASEENNEETETNTDTAPR